LWGHNSRFEADFPHEILELDTISSRLKTVSPQTIQYLYNVFKDTQLVDDLLHDTFPENYNLSAKTNYLQTIDELKYKKSQATFKALQIGNKT
jgi:hypothetical protein